MTKSELIELIARRQTQFSQKDVEIAVNQIVDSMINTLSQGDRIEIRGFGSFSLHHRKARVGRNPKTGETVKLNDKRVPHFKPGKALREAVDQSKDYTDIIA
ncbi:integration host factor subunit beta [Thiomicrorhabdus indica]|uniref:integration host factor subunit beta n=1 Tax=Thiomicrorhabdus indica TaxID=2267253 RepID=UPI00102DC501|nr:integration host factor subunit beta [Thiomicrorhabdus indica]